MNERVYLDHNATTPVDKRVLEAMLPYLQESFGNASSTHIEGQKARGAVEEARAEVAEFFGATPAEVVFTSGGTEADSLGVLGVVRRYGQKGQKVFISAIEHPAVRESGTILMHEGFNVEWIPVERTGVVDVTWLEDHIDERPVLVAVMAVNNETGVIQPVREVGELCRAKGVFFHVDAVQACGKMKVSPKDWGAHTCALSGHKIYGPKGVGALYIEQGIEVVPLFGGGKHERGRRPGTENVPGIVGLGKAIALVRQQIDEDIRKFRDLQTRFEQELRKTLPDIVIFGAGASRVGNTTFFSIPYLDGQSFMMRLDMEGFAVSTGSACASGRIEPSHVVIAMGYDDVYSYGTIRVSTGRSTTFEELAQFVQVVQQCYPDFIRKNS